jgi:hypothetical protein
MCRALRSPIDGHPMSPSGDHPAVAHEDHGRLGSSVGMGSLIKKRRKRMRKKKHKKMLKATRWQRRAAGK